MGAPRVTWTQFFLSPHGRFDRSQYWGATFAVYGGALAYLMPLLLSRDESVPDALAIPYAVVGGVLFLVAVVAHMFTIVKRFHDRDKAWPWCLMVFVPYIGGLWILVECGFLAGTPGPNAFDAESARPASGEVL